MSFIDSFKKLSREKKIIMAVSATVVVAAVVVVCIVLSRSKYLATTMRLLHAGDRCLRSWASLPSSNSSDFVKKLQPRCE